MSAQTATQNQQQTVPISLNLHSCPAASTEECGCVVSAHGLLIKCRIFRNSCEMLNTNMGKVEQYKRQTMNKCSMQLPTSNKYSSKYRFYKKGEFNLKPLSEFYKKRFQLI